MSRHGVEVVVGIMPEADYTSKPSTMPEVRAYGQLFGHVANAQFFQRSAATGQPNPNPPSTENQPARGAAPAGPGGGRAGGNAPPQGR